jgi:hypothetical protein
MFRYHQVLLVLKNFLSADLALMITSFYNILCPTIKPGQFVFDSPCGHVLRYIKGYKSKTFTCPINNENYMFDKEVYVKAFWHNSGKNMLYFVESTKKSPWIGITCDICNRYWDFTHRKTDLEQKIVCFCGKLTNQFPCESCPVNKCSIPGCILVAHQNSVPLVCRNHSRCGNCKKLFNYDGWIKNYCKCGQNV